MDLSSLPFHIKRHRTGDMRSVVRGFGGVKRALMLLAVVLLLAAPVLPAAAAQPMDDCCPQAPCHADTGKVVCPTACVLACQAIVAAEQMVAQPTELEPVATAWIRSTLSTGRTPAPEVPPPR